MNSWLDFIRKLMITKYAMHRLYLKMVIKQFISFLGLYDESLRAC